MRIEALAAALDVSHMTVRNIEHGRDCYLQTLPRLAQVFGVSLDYLFGLTDDPTPAHGALAQAAALD
jgi:transcriptional regulator with XRE-family HTH domain